MPRGEESAELATWIKLLRASVAPRLVAIVCVISATLALTLFGLLAATDSAAREHWVLERSLQVLQSMPPTDAILAQLPPERLASVRTRGLEVIHKMLTPLLIGAVVASALAALIYALIAKPLRRRWSDLFVPRTALALVPRSSTAAFIVCTCLAIAVHLPHALQSIRYDEDLAAVNAASGLWGWANNLNGWNNHVAASFTMRVFTALFGLNELAVRMPAVLASSLSLALLCTTLQRRYSTWLGWMCALTFMALPLWAEQTSLARGYGLTFSAGVLMVVGLLRLQDEGDQLSSATLGCLFASVFIGCLAHFYFVFLAIALFVMIARMRRLSSDLRIAVLWALALAGAVPVLSFLIGLPGTLIAVQQSGQTTATQVFDRFSSELAFRHAGAAGTALIVLSAALIAISALLMPRNMRKPYCFLMSVALFCPLLGQPTFVYPRYFIHTSAFIVPCVTWFVSMRVLRGSALAHGLACAALIGLYASTKPWNVPVWVDLRGASRIAREESSAHGQHFAIDTFLTSGVRFYNGDPGRIVNSTHPIPSNVEHLLLGVVPAQADARVPAEFQIERRIPGAEHDILLLRRDHALTQTP